MEQDNKKTGFKDKLVKVLKLFWKSIKQTVEVFLESYKYNKMKFAATFIFLPAVLLGLMLNEHTIAVSRLNESVEGFAKGIGIYLFAIVLLGCINIFNAFSLNSKKNLFSAIFNSVTTVLMLVFGGLYIGSFFAHWNEITKDSNVYLSIVFVGLSLLSALAGTIISYFFINWNYKKVK